MSRHPVEDIIHARAVVYGEIKATVYQAAQLGRAALYNVHHHNGSGGVLAKDLLFNRLGGHHVAHAKLAGEDQDVHDLPSFFSINNLFSLMVHSIAGESFVGIKRR